MKAKTLPIVETLSIMKAKTLPIVETLPIV